MRSINVVACEASRFFGAITDSTQLPRTELCFIELCQFYSGPELP
jgi:hypothetical protein